MRQVKRNSVVLITVFLLSFVDSFAQVELSLERYVANIKEYHPYIKIANNKLQKAEYKFKASKGAFDPKLNGSWDIKNFDGKTYFDIREAKVKSNTRLGIAPILKYQNNAGYFLNPERTNPNTGLIGAGVELPLLRGLRTDELRTKYNITKINQERQVFTNDSTINKIIARAIGDYLDWATSYYKLQAITSLFDVRNARYQNVSTMYLGGNIAAMDTLDAYAQLQKTKREVLGAEIKLLKYQNKVKNHIWEPNLYSTADSLQPANLESIETFLLPKNVNINIDEHNYVQSIVRLKEMKEKELLYKKEQFKPKANLELLPLSAFQSNGYVPGEFSSSNFFAGVSVEIPLYFRKQTNNYKIGWLELQIADYKLNYQKRKLATEFSTYAGNTNQLKSQYSISLDNVKNLRLLRDMEEEKFFVGESSLIKLNLRENKYIDERIKTVSVFNKYASNLIELNLLLQQYN